VKRLGGRKKKGASEEVKLMGLFFWYEKLVKSRQKPTGRGRGGKKRAKKSTGGGKTKKKKSDQTLRESGSNNRKRRSGGGRS